MPADPRKESAALWLLRSVASATPQQTASQVKRLPSPWVLLGRKKRARASGAKGVTRQRGLECATFNIGTVIAELNKGSTKHPTILCSVFRPEWSKRFWGHPVA